MATETSGPALPIHNFLSMPKHNLLFVPTQAFMKLGREVASETDAS